MQKMMVEQFGWDERYRVAGSDEVLTPALAVYPEIIEGNIAEMLRLVGGDADRWRVHLKTAKLGYTMRMLLGSGVQYFKCATTLELLTACEHDAPDVLLAYPMVGANARRVLQIASEFPRTRISVLAENEQQVQQWKHSAIGVFLDINPGMNRTGIEQERKDRIVELARAVTEAKAEFRGLHYYDGQYANVPHPQRTLETHRGYARLLEIVASLEERGLAVAEVVTAGTPTLPCSLGFLGFQGRKFVHRVSPGTIVYGDATSLAQLPREWNFRPAVLVLARVVSHPCEDEVTCDAGHKSVSADAGVPTCVVAGHAELLPRGPSEEHLPIAVEKGKVPPGVGELLFLLPRHVCPTVNNFDQALVVRNGSVESVEKVEARGHEGPLKKTAKASMERSIRTHA